MLVVPTDGLRFSAGNEVKTLPMGSIYDVFVGIQEGTAQPLISSSALTLLQTTRVLEALDGLQGSCCGAQLVEKLRPVHTFV